MLTDGEEETPMLLSPCLIPIRKKGLSEKRKGEKNSNKVLFTLSYGCVLTVLQLRTSCDKGFSSLISLVLDEVLDEA